MAENNDKNWTEILVALGILKTEIKHVNDTLTRLEGTVATKADLISHQALTEAEFDAVTQRVEKLESDSVWARRLVYSSLTTALISIGVAAFTFVTRGGMPK